MNKLFILFVLKSVKMALFALYNTDEVSDAVTEYISEFLSDILNETVMHKPKRKIAVITQDSCTISTDHILPEYKKRRLYPTECLPPITKQDLNKIDLTPLIVIKNGRHHLRYIKLDISL